MQPVQAAKLVSRAAVLASRSISSSLRLLGRPAPAIASNSFVNANWELGQLTSRSSPHLAVSGAGVAPPPSGGAGDVSSGVSSSPEGVSAAADVAAAPPSVAKAPSKLTTAFKPSEVVKSLDDYIVGQADAKRAVAIALRNRWRRKQLNDDFKNEVSGPVVFLRATRRSFLHRSSSRRLTSSPPPPLPPPLPLSPSLTHR